MTSDNCEELERARKEIQEAHGYLDKLGFWPGHRLAYRIRCAVEVVELRGVESMRERAAQTAQSTPFRAHSQDDVDYHSGCEQTRDRIVGAIRALAPANCYRPTSAQLEEPDWMTGHPGGISEA